VQRDVDQAGGKADEDLAVEVIAQTHHGSTSIRRTADRTKS
jgi:hypothetical protein